MPIKILMPALSPTMTHGNLVKWHKKEGDMVSSGDLIAEIETDKATMEVEAVDEGVLAKIFVLEGTEDVAVNTLIGALLEEGEDPSALATLVATIPAPAAAEIPAPAPMEAPTPVQTPTPAPVQMSAPAPTAGRLMATPLARRIAATNNLDLRCVAGSGPHGRIIKADVEGALASPSSRTNMPFVEAPRTGDGLFPAFEDIKLSNMRKVIAKRLTQAKQEVPHFYLSVDCEIDTLLKARQDLNETLTKEERLSVNDFVIKAAAYALQAVPDANASYIDGVMRRYHSVDISVAVAVEGGLVTPIIRDAQRKPLGLISSQMKELVKKAKDGKLRPEEFQGGTFSISNLGMYGVKSFSAVINPPQGCILAVGAGEKRAVVKDNALTIATVMTCTLSVDHRVVDGAVGAEFLHHFKKAIEAPILMFAS